MKLTRIVQGTQTICFYFFLIVLQYKNSYLLLKFDAVDYPQMMSYYQRLARKDDLK